MGSGISFSGWMFLIRTDSGAGGDGVEEEEENVVVVVVVVVAVATDGGSTSIAVDSSGLAMSASISSYASISAMEVSSYEASMAASRSQGSSMILNFRFWFGGLQVQKVKKIAPHSPINPCLFLNMGYGDLKI